jgi:tripartite ATP-independent transporter DctM subunit
MTTLLSLLVVMIALIVIGLPISIALLLSGIGIFWAADIPLQTVSIRLFNAVVKHELFAIPVFIVMGNILSESGMALRLIGLANSMVGFMRGGLAMVNVVTGMFLSEMSGASTADAAILGKVFVPSMTRVGYDRGFAAAVTSASASLAILIPPSIPMIVLGLYTDISVAQLFLAGFIPGFLITIFELVVCAIVSRRRNYPIAAKFSIAELFRNLLNCWFVLLVPIVILGSIFTGFATVTESALLGLAITVVGGVFYGKLSFQDFARLTGTGIRQSAVILLIVAASTLVAWVFANEQVASSIIDTVGALPIPAWAHLLWINLFLIILGTFLHGSATIIIVAPLLLPLMTTLGVDPLQFGMVIVVSQAIGQQTPPVASVLLTVASTTSVAMEEILASLWPFLLMFVLVLLIVTFVPTVSTLIPHLVG